MKLKLPRLNFFPNHYPSSSIIIHLRKQKFKFTVCQIEFENPSHHHIIASSLSERLRPSPSKAQKLAWMLQGWSAEGKLTRRPFKQTRHTQTYAILQVANYEFQGVVEIRGIFGGVEILMFCWDHLTKLDSEPK